MIAPADTLTIPLAHLDRISLPDLQTEAAFLTRADRKYLVPVELAARMVASTESTTRVLEINGRNDFTYVSPYFDDADDTAYLSAARGRASRFKVRTRLYKESGLCMLELKVRDSRGRTVKYRTRHDASALEFLREPDRDWLRTFPAIARFADELRHCLTTHYLRTTLALPNGEGRVTIDRNLIFALPGGTARTLPDLAIIETKGLGHPTSFDSLLWQHGVRPRSMSKFTIGRSLLVPDLPANRWHRIRSHLDAVACPIPTPPLLLAAD